MTIDEKLFQILTASPPPVPAIGSAWWANNAGQSSVPPYGVFELISSPQILTQDRQTSTRQWRYQLRIVDDDYLEGRHAMELLWAFLVNYTNAPAPGIQRFIVLNKHSNYLQMERSHCHYIDVDIMENLQ